MFATVASSKEAVLFDAYICIFCCLCLHLYIWISSLSLFVYDVFCLILQAKRIFNLSMRINPISTHVTIVYNKFQTDNYALITKLVTESSYLSRVIWLLNIMSLYSESDILIIVFIDFETIYLLPNSICDQAAF